MTSPNTILLKVNRLSDKPTEKRAGGTIKPGHLIMVVADGTVVVHATADGYAELMVALEDAYQGKTIDDAYAAGDLVFAQRLQPTDLIYARLAPSNAIWNGSYLSSNGDGRLKKASGASSIGLFTSEETIASSGSEVWVRARAVTPGAAAGAANTTTTTTTTSTTTTTTSSTSTTTTTTT